MTKTGLKELHAAIREADRATQKLQECLEDNKRKTYAVQRSQIENESLKDRIRELERKLGKPPEPMVDDPEGRWKWQLAGDGVAGPVFCKVKPDGTLWTEPAK